MVSSASKSADQLRSDIAKAQAKLNAKQGKAHVLTSTISDYSRRVNALQTRISALNARLDPLESDLAKKRATLITTQTALRGQRVRLVGLQRRLANARSTLSARLLDQYQNGKTDLLSVLIDSNGFEQLLERGEYASKLAAQDRYVLTAVASAKKDADAQATQLAKLESQQQAVTSAVAQRRDAIAQTRNAVADVQGTLKSARNSKRQLLISVNASKKDVQEDLSTMQAQQAKIEAKLEGLGTLPPVKQGKGAMIWPVNGPITAPFCERRAWEACHPGMDIGVPIGTPIRAALGGKVAIASWVGGYGNYTCVQDTKVMSTCYGHQSKFLVSVGQVVTQGQVIGLSGNTGHTTGPHLHFEVRLNGAVTNPINYL